MFDFIVHTPEPGYTVAVLDDLTSYVSFNTKVEGLDIGCRVSGVVRVGGIERRSCFSVGSDDQWGCYFHTQDEVRDVA